MKIVTRSAEQTIALGEKLGALLGGGEIIAYTGDLGAGKTTMTRGISIGMGLGDEVTSPTFALVNEYHGAGKSLYHFDMYRITSSEDLETTGFYDYMDGNSVIAAEWSENIAEALETLGQDILQIDIKRVDDDTREINITWKMKGTRALKLLAIETSGKTASAAVTDGQTLLAEKTIYTKLTHCR